MATFDGEKREDYVKRVKKEAAMLTPSDLDTEEKIKAIKGIREKTKRNAIRALHPDNDLLADISIEIERRQRNLSKYSDDNSTEEFFNTEMTTLDSVEIEEIDWLVPRYIPKGQIVIFAGDGGSGKTTTWCSILASISSGKRTIFEHDISLQHYSNREPQTCMFFSSEDSVSHVLADKLKRHGANMKNIQFIDLKDERFSNIRYDSGFLHQLVKTHKPALVVFDPTQSFIDPKIQMGQRNAMRSSMNPLIGLGEKYGTTFMIVAHTNKKQGIHGRTRIADSADIWDIARSVLMTGDTSDKNVKYLSHEKSNYGILGDTLLLSLNEDEILVVEGTTDKRDREFMAEWSNSIVEKRISQPKEEAKQFILDYLKKNDGEVETADLDSFAKAATISKNSLMNAKAELKKEKVIEYRNTGKGKTKKFYISLIGCE